MSTSDEERKDREATQRSLNVSAARDHTNDLRQSEEPRWQRLRRRLEQNGIAVEDAAVAEKATADTSLESGLVITNDGRAFYFEFNFLRDEEGRKLAYEDARVSAWEELDEGRRGIYARELEAGREVLKREASEE